MFVIVHLALGRRSRRAQLSFLHEMIQSHLQVVIMGDLNARLANAEMSQFLDRCGLLAPASGQHTFPSWRPQRGIDHILVSESLRVEQCEVLDLCVSDHRPLALDLCLPAGWSPGLVAYESRTSEVANQNL